LDWSLHITKPLLMFAAGAFGCMVIAAVLGFVLRLIFGRRGLDASVEGQENYIVSAVLGLLALLMGFTFALAVDRFEIRRGLVLDEANAIGTTYLRAQLLPAPHRERISRLLTAYVDNRLVLAATKPADSQKALAVNDQILTDLWGATAAAFDDIEPNPFTISLLDTTNSMIDMDSSRKAARSAHVPSEVFTLLVIYLVVTSAVLGYVLKGARGRVAASLLLVLLTLSLTMIVDIDRPTVGGIRETQGPMEALRSSMVAQPGTAFDRWRRPDRRTGAALPAASIAQP
jgi:hypothetical protein